MVAKKGPKKSKVLKKAKKLEKTRPLSITVKQKVVD